LSFGYSRIATYRRSILLSNLDLAGKTILELGPLDNPTVMKGEADVYYLDWFSSDELRQQLSKTSRQVERVVDVDYVVKGSNFSDFVDKKFDLIVANHVIEHVPDLIDWAGQLERLTHESSFVFLSVPDKRYTFDVSVRSTDAIDVYQRHKEGLQKADLYHIMRHQYYFQRVNAESVWKGNVPDKSIRAMSIQEAERIGQEKSKTYSSIHCSIFTDEEFSILWSDLVREGLLDWEIDRIFPTSAPRNEFHVIMKRTRRHADHSRPHL
jgi:hypothetical protein